MVEAFHENVGMIFSLPMLVDSHAAFVMLSLCYAQCLNYFLHTMFPSLGILQHYAEFDTCTIATSEKLLGVGSFVHSIGQLVYHQATLPISLGGLCLFFVVQIIAPTFLGCWALIVPTFVTHF
jgi:hypothetical protein